MPWRRRSPDGGVMIAVHVQPAAKRTEVAGRHGEALKIRLAAPPIDGKANAALIDFIASLLGVPRSRVTLVVGNTSRQKVVRVEGCDESALAALETLAGD